MFIDLENKNKIAFKTWTEDGKVIQERDFFGSMTTEIIDIAAAVKEQKTREALIALGWTPPPK